MMKKTTLLLFCAVLVLALASGAKATVVITKTETFDSAESAAANGWVEHNTRESGFQNFGYDGGGGGRAGGSYARSAKAADSYSYYADVFVVPLDWTYSFSATGSWSRVNPQSKGVNFGFFNTDDTSSGVASQVRISLRDETRFNLGYRTDSESSATSGEVGYSGSSGNFKIAYNADTKVLSCSFGGQNRSLTIPNALTVNAFGIFNNANPTGSHGQDETGFYIDNLTYDAGVPEPATIGLLGLGGLALLRRRR